MGLRFSGSRPARQEQWAEFLGVAGDGLELLAHRDFSASIASGSYPFEAMAVVPCSMGTMARIATGASTNLIERAADVALKERRQLILVPRESPFSAIHLENMLKLARLGVTILPAAPGFYHRPQSVDDLIDFVVARILDQLGVEQTLVKRWGE